MTTAASIDAIIRSNGGTPSGWGNAATTARLFRFTRNEPGQPAESLGDYFFNDGMDGVVLAREAIAHLLNTDRITAAEQKR